MCDTFSGLLQHTIQHMSKVQQQHFQPLCPAGLSALLPDGWASASAEGLSGAANRFFSARSRCQLSCFLQSSAAWDALSRSVHYCMLAAGAWASSADMMHSSTVAAALHTQQPSIASHVKWIGPAPSSSSCPCFSSANAQVLGVRLSRSCICGSSRCCSCCATSSACCFSSSS